MQEGLLEFLIGAIKAKASKQTAYDSALEDGDGYFIAMDHFGGNFDDAYAGGCEDGEINFAQMLKTIIDSYKE